MFEKFNKSKTQPVDSFVNSSLRAEEKKNFDSFEYNCDSPRNSQRAPNKNFTFHSGCKTSSASNASSNSPKNHEKEAPKPSRFKATSEDKMIEEDSSIALSDQNGPGSLRSEENFLSKLRDN